MDPYVYEYKSLSSLPKDATETASPSIDPTFPEEVLREQEDFIFGTGANEQPEETKPEPLELSKWDLYERRVFKLSKLLARKSKTVLRKDGQQRDIFCYQIFSIKRRIKTVLAEISAENAQDYRYTHLDEPNEDGMVDLEGVNCSKCGGPDAPGNDILICDKEGCCRAYHQQCLDPQVDPAQLQDEAYWFCWVCGTIQSSLAWINTKLGTNFEKPEEVFPNLDTEAKAWEGKFSPDFYDPENPTPVVKNEGPVRRRRKKSQQQEVSDAEEDIEESPVRGGQGSNQSKRRREEDPNRPKYADNGYIIYSRKMLPELKKQFPHMKHQEVMRKLGESWMVLSLDERAEYEREGSRNKAEYRERLMEFMQKKRDVDPSALEQLRGPGLKSLVCPICGKIFKTEGGIRYHSQNVCVMDVYLAKKQQQPAVEVTEDPDATQRQYTSELQPDEDPQIDIVEV